MKIKITDKINQASRVCSPEEAKKYINSEYPNICSDLDGMIKTILDGLPYDAPHDVFERVSDKELEGESTSIRKGFSQKAKKVNKRVKGRRESRQRSPKS